MTPRTCSTVNSAPKRGRVCSPATTLTEDQRNALLRGDTAQIPVEQLEYLAALSNSLDGQSASELTGLLGQLSPEQGQALSGAVALASNPHVAAGPAAPGRPDGPQRGDAAHIPQAFQQVLNGPVLNEHWSQPAMPGTPQPPGGPQLPQPISAPTVAPGLDDLATFVGAADPTLQTGSTISDGLMDKSRELLDVSEKVTMPVYPDGHMQDRPQWYHDRVDSTLQHMLSVAGRDSISLQDAVTGRVPTTS
ncbi:hypothetical protein [Mycobacterium sp. 236(2023)]|uniref:TPR repeat region-containing protein n=1 Tax=Mycobacterium sp. 236(2023) TaxID=3038163 RepID=UPI0024156C53|nr:hypothetical protein [Mycobacterium sp. 236(2023)]MDG4667890.1 hypothetical protein [Mycobacterium sp. 236(2023)]